MFEILAIALLSVGSLPPLEPPVKQKPPEAAPADQAAGSAGKAAVPTKPALSPLATHAPQKPDLGPAARPELRSEAEPVPPKKSEPAPDAEAPKKAARVESKKSKKPEKPLTKADKPEGEKGHEGKPGEEGKSEPSKGESEAPSEDAQHAAAPSLAPGAICDELRRAARDRREDRLKLTQEREALTKERTRLEALAEEITQARAALKEETSRLQAVIDKAAEKAKGAAKPGAPLPLPKPSAGLSGAAPSFADAGRK